MRNKRYKLVMMDGYYFIVPRWQDFMADGILYKAKVKKDN